MSDYSKTAKQRTGGPIDDEEDMDLKIRAGLIPDGTKPGKPEQYSGPGTT